MGQLEKCLLERLNVKNAHFDSGCKNASGNKKKVHELEIDTSVNKMSPDND